MRKTKYFFLLGIMAMYLSSCDSCDGSSKDDTASGGAVWSLGTQGYSSPTATGDRTNMEIHATSGSTDGIFVKYGSFPATGKTYKIVSFFKTPLAADEVSVEVDHGTSDVWLSTGYGGKSAYAGTENGELRLSSELGISAIHANSNGPQTDSSTVSFNVPVK